VDEHWVDRARRELLERRAPGGSWGYRDGGSPAVEPTALAGLGLIASGNVLPTDSNPAGATGVQAAVRRAGAWLDEHQRRDGSMPAVPGSSMPGWATPHAMLLWSRLEGFEDRRRRARDWLVSVAGQPLQVSPENRSVLGHDPGLIGWSWVVGTHSWLEPTAMAILALGREGCFDHPRVRQGLGLIVDRAIPGGGWNYGNKIVFGQVLRPQPGPTGLALLALAARGPRAGPVVAPALDYLRRTLPSTRAAASIGWGVLGLKAHDACPPEAETWLAEAFAHCTGKPDSIVGLSLLLLAAEPRDCHADGGHRPPIGRHGLLA
jgi:hypothetical protein